MPGPGIPEIKWGTFFDVGGVAHVAPKIEETLMKGHRLALGCPCAPSLQKGQNHLIVVHHVVH